MRPRKPNKQEKQELIAYYQDAEKHDMKTAKEIVSAASIAVFDDYCTEAPGYAGKVMVLIGSHDPSYVDLFVWDRFYENGKVNIPIRDTSSPEEGHYTMKLRHIEPWDGGIKSGKQDID